MKKKLFLLAFTIAIAFSALCMAVSADNAAPKVGVYAYNIVFGDQVYIEYAVKVEGVSGVTASDIGMLVWKESTPTHQPETADADLKVLKTATVDGSECFVLRYTELSAKEMTDTVFSQPYLNINGQIHYGQTVEYSVATYAKRKLGLVSGVEGTKDENLRVMLRSMLEYGANAQRYFNYKTETLATDILKGHINIIYNNIEDAENPNPAALEYESGKYALRVPVKKGFIFVGWEDPDSPLDLIKEIDTSAIKNISLTAIWQLENYPIIYRNTKNVLQDGDLRFDNYYTVLDSVNPCALEKYDYNFKGWRIGSAYGDFIGENGIPAGTTGTLELYADWTIKPEFEGFDYIVDDNYFLPNGQNFCILMGVSASVNGVTKFEIPDVFNHIQAGALTQVSGLEELTLPYLGSDYTGTAGSYLGYLFGANTALTQSNLIPQTLKKVTVNGSGRIGENAFRDCTNLVEIVVSGTSSDIGENAYLGCTSLVSLTTPVYYNDAMNYSKISRSPMYQTDYYYGIPGAVKGENRKDTAFGKKLTPDIPVGSFETLHINGGEIGSYAFKNNCAIKHLIIEGVDVIRDHACAQLQYMETLELHEGLKQIQNSAFYNCENENFTELIIPNSVTSLCGYDYDEVNGYKGPITGYSAPADTFHLCSNLSKIVIGDGVEVIPNQCFDRHYPKTPLELTLGKKVRVIGHWALMAEINGGFSCNISKLINNSEQEEMVIYWQGENDGSEFLNVLKNCGNSPKKIYLGSYEDGKNYGTITDVNHITEEQLRSFEDTFELVLASAVNPYEYNTALEGFDYWHGKNPEYYWIHSQYDEVVLWDRPAESGGQTGSE